MAAAGAEQSLPHTTKDPQTQIKMSGHKSKKTTNLPAGGVIGRAVAAQPVRMRQFIHQFSVGS